MLIDLMVNRANAGYERMDLHRHATFSRSISRLFRRIRRLFA